MNKLLISCLFVCSICFSQTGMMTKEGESGMGVHLSANLYNIEYDDADEWDGVEAMFTQQLENARSQNDCEGSDSEEEDDDNNDNDDINIMHMIMIMIYKQMAPYHGTRHDAFEDTQSNLPPNRRKKGAN